jgi:ligand-binding SRPBCC domain-containing protein
MKSRILQSEIWLNHPIGKVFPFFADAANLERLTLPLLRFHILTPTPIEMKVGARIAYRLRVHGIPIQWESEVTAWAPPFRFVDEQRHGPYRLWIHEHTFIVQDGGTLVGDHVEYQVPGGSLVDRFLVAPDLRKIFAYRRKVLSGVFP